MLLPWFSAEARVRKDKSLTEPEAGAECSNYPNTSGDDSVLPSVSYIQ